MKQGYLFVHFKETRTPEGEQVYFGLSKDGFHWRALNNGKPVLWSMKGDLGVRDMTIIRSQNGLYHIFATDLSLAYGMPGKYDRSWENIKRYGSKGLMHWVSKDLIHWEEQQFLQFDTPDFGCLWAPDILFDQESEQYILHWSSTLKQGDGILGHAIWYSATRDFKSWSTPKELYRKADAEVIDSALYQEDGLSYLFIKSGKNPDGVTLLVSDKVEGPYEPHPGFSYDPLQEQANLYEAPTAFKLTDGRWCLLVDYFGVPGKGQGYVPYLANSLKEGRFSRATQDFSFPYGFKHGTVLTLTEDEYERLNAAGEFPEQGGLR